MKKDWVLTQDAFDKLLDLFDSERERAAEKYEFVRLHLIKMFEGRGCSPSRELADEAVNRVIRRIEDGEVIRLDTLTNYFYGVARNVLREYLRSPESTFSSTDSYDFSDSASKTRSEIAPFDSEDNSEREMDCLERCLEEHPPETQRMILSYYDWEKGEKIDSRRRLAQELGVTINTLRIRAHRIRDSLEKCAVRCMEDKSGRVK